MQFYLSEFHEEAFRKGMHDEGYEEGYNAGLLDSAIKSIKVMKRNNITKDVVISELVSEYEMTEEYAMSLVNEHWE